MIITELFTYDFMQRALILLVFASIISGIIGTFLVVKKISMVGGSISHGAFGGMGIAYFLGINPVLGAMVFSMIGGSFLSWVYVKMQEKLESVLMIFWAGGMAIGLIFIFLTPGYNKDLFSYLFGNVLLSSRLDIFFLGTVMLIIVFSYLLVRRDLLSVLFNQKYAKLVGIKSSRLTFLMFLLISIGIVMLLKTMGILLTLAILTINPLISSFIAKTLDRIIITSIVLNLLTSLMGVIIGYFIDLPIAPVIIILQILTFIGVRIYKLI